jgi:hypothetical protein
MRETEDCIELDAFHDGYKRLTDPVIHHRRLKLLKREKKLLLSDRLDCTGKHEVDVFFHFHEHCDVRQTGVRSFTAQIENSRLHITLDTHLTPELVRGSEHPILGWVSRTYGLKEPSTTLIGRTTIKGSGEFVTEIAGESVKRAA